MADAVVVLDVDQRVVQWNRGAEELFGWTLTEVIGHPVPMVPDDRKAEYHAVLERVRVGRPISITTRRIRRDGGLLDVRASFNRLTDVHGAMIGWVCVFHPHTLTPSESEREQLHLAERAHLVRRLTDMMTDISADQDVEGILDRVVTGLTELTGADAGGFALIEEDSLRLASAARLSHKLLGFRAGLRHSLLGELLAGGKKVLLTTDEARPLQDLVWADLKGLRTVALCVCEVRGRPYGGLYALYRRRRISHLELEMLELLAAHAGVALGNAMAYRETVRQRAHEHAIVESSADGIAVLDRRGRVRKWNRSAAELTGSGRNEVVGNPPPFPVPEEPGQLLRHRMDNGRWLEVLVTDIAGTGERVVDFRDITPAKELEEQKDLFLATAGHELRTPLTVLRLQLSMAKRKLGNHFTLPGVAEGAQLLDQLERQVERLVPLVDEMLDVARIQSGKLEIRPERFDMTTLIEDVLERFLPLLQEAGCEASIDCPDGAVGSWDRFRIEQVISNLLSNAARHGGGAVHVHLRCEPDAVELRVSDQGPGISPEDRQRIFQPFERIDAERGQAGLGLGLHIVRQIVEMHGGSIDVESAPGSGATFVVRLPWEPVKAGD